MGKQKKQMIILLILLAAALCGYFGLRAGSRKAAQEEADAAEAAKIKAMDIERDDIQSISYEYMGVTYSFEHDGEEWSYPDDTSVSIRKSALDNLADNAAQIVAEEKIENVTDLEQYGLADPTITAKITTADHTFTICIGDYNSMVGKYYLYVDDPSVVYTVSSVAATNFNKDLDDVREEEVEETASDGDVSAGNP